MQPHVRRFAKERLVDALSCAAVDSFFYLTLDTAQQRDDLLPAPNATVEAVHAAAVQHARELGEGVVAAVGRDC